MSLDTLAPPSVDLETEETTPRDLFHDVPWSAWHLSTGLAVMLAWRGITAWLDGPLGELPPMWRIGIGILFPLGWMLFWPRSTAQGDSTASVREMPDLATILREGAIGVGLGACIVAALFAANALCAWLTGQSLGSVNDMAQGPPEEVFTLVLLSFTLTPLAEETFFRGFLYRSLRMPCGMPGALVVQAAIFAMLHSDEGLRLLSIGAIGLTLGAIYEWRRSLVAGIAAHATVNFVWAVAISMMMLMNAHAPYLGVVGEEQPEGLVVRQVLPDSPAAQGGIQPGDILLSLDGAPLARREQLTRVIRGKPVGSRVVLEVTRGGKPVQAEAVLVKRPRQ